MSWAGAPVVALIIAALAQAPAAVPETPVAEGHVRIPAGTVLTIEIVDALSSKTAQIDQYFAIRLAEPLVINGREMLPAGIAGRGQVIHAAKARAMGKPGELSLAARTLDCGGTAIALRGFRLGGQGKNNSTAIVLGNAAAGVFAAPLMFVSGGEKISPSGVLGTARTAAPVDIRPACTTSTTAN